MTKTEIKLEIQKVLDSVPKTILQDAIDFVASQDTLHYGCSLELIKLV